MATGFESHHVFCMSWLPDVIRIDHRIWGGPLWETGRSYSAYRGGEAAALSLAQDGDGPVARESGSQEPNTPLFLSRKSMGTKMKIKMNPCETVKLPLSPEAKRKQNAVGHACNWLTMCFCLSQKSQTKHIESSKWFCSRHDFGIRRRLEYPMPLDTSSRLGNATRCFWREMIHCHH